MREIRTSGSEGGGTETNRSFLPLSWSWQVLQQRHSDLSPVTSGL